MLDMKIMQINFNEISGGHMKKIIIMFFFLVLLSFSLLAQVKPEIIKERFDQAVSLSNSGKYEKAIELLNDVKKVDKKNFLYDYHLGFAYYKLEDYLSAARAYTDACKFKEANVECYQMLGKMYTLTNEYEKAIKTIEKGLKKFPASGMLYFELGTIHEKKQNLDQALKSYEQGIKINPEYSSNYYGAALIYCHSEDKVWGLIYGEVLINLEFQTQQAADLSKILYDTYRNSITISARGDSIKISLNKNLKVDMSDTKNQDIMAYETFVFETNLLTSTLGIKEMNFANLVKIRTRFMENYYEKGFDKTHPNPLFTFTKKILDDGHYEAYNYWLFMMGDIEIFREWLKHNHKKWDAFQEWNNYYKLKIDGNNIVSSDMYLKK